MFNISEFVSKLRDFNGIALTSKFSVTITPPSFADASVAADLSYLCRTAALPSMDLDVQKINRYGTGYDMPYPTSKVDFGTFMCLIMLDSLGQTQKFFKDWMDNVIIPESIGNSGTYRVNYKSQYATTITVTHYDTEGNEINTYTFYDAFPSSTGKVQMDWQSTNQMAELPVLFQYRNWNLNSATSSGTSQSTNQSALGVQQFTSIPTTIPITPPPTTPF